MTQMMQQDETILQNDTKGSVVAVYETHEQAEAAVKALQHQGFDMTKLSIAGKDFHTKENVVGYYNTSDRMKAWGATGAFWGGFGGMFLGAALFIVPVVGPIVVVGPLVAGILGALEGAALVGGLSVLGAALVGIGIPHDSAVKYETELQAGKFVLIVHGTRDEIDQAHALLDLTQHQGLTTHSA